MEGDPDSSVSSSGRDLYVEFELDPPAGAQCPLGGFDDEVADIRQQLVGDRCHTDTTVLTADCACGADRDCSSVVHSATDVDPSCPCAVFGEHGCVPELVDVVDGRIRVETYLPDRERLSDLVNDLKEVVDGLRLRQLKRIDTGSPDRTQDVVTLDLYEFTEKQREAVAFAVSAGYYSSPRETTLEELAAAFDISKSAFSQRLSAVESKLATAAFEWQGLAD